MAEPTDTATAPETWLYAGVRLNGTKKLHAWWDGSELHYFEGLAGSIPGAPYRVDAKRGDAGAVSVAGKPIYLGSDQSSILPTYEQETEWRAEHLAARQTIEANRMEKIARTHDELEQALEVIRRHYTAIRGYQKRGAFAAYVAGEMTRPPRKPISEEDRP